MPDPHFTWLVGYAGVVLLIAGVWWLGRRSGQ